MGAREDYEEQFGVALTEIDGFAEVYPAPRAGAGLDPITVVLGEFPRHRIEEAVGSDPGWNDVVEVAEHDGTEFWSWLDDGESDPERADRLHPLGRRPVSP